MNKLKYILIVIVIIICIIGLKVYKSITKVDNNLEKETSIVSMPDNRNTEIINEQGIETIENNNSEKKNASKEGKVVASNGFEFDEQDLKEKISTYLIYENFMQDYFVPEQELENANIVDYANEAKVFIGIYLASKIYESPTEEQVRKAVEEFCGEHYNDFIDTAEYWIAFDGDDHYEYVQAGDYDPSGYCNTIENINEQDGKYTVTFIYSRPSESDFVDNVDLDSLPKFRKQFTFIYHEDAQYTNYQLTELSFLKGEEVK